MLYLQQCCWQAELHWLPACGPKPNPFFVCQCCKWSGRGAAACRHSSSVHWLQLRAPLSSSSGDLSTAFGLFSFLANFSALTASFPNGWTCDSSRIPGRAPELLKGSAEGQNQSHLPVLQQHPGPLGQAAKTHFKDSGNKHSSVMQQNTCHRYILLFPRVKIPHGTLPSSFSNPRLALGHREGLCCAQHT